MEQEQKLCGNCQRITYLGDRVSDGGGCEAAVTARTRCMWVKFRECGVLLYGRRFPLRLNGQFIRVIYGQQYYMKMRHGARKKERWEFYEGQKNSW